MSAITTHVLDTAEGRPATGIAVRLEVETSPGVWKLVGQGATDADGRVGKLLGEGAALAAATYRLTFDTGAYFAGRGQQSFYPQVSVVFTVREPGQHYHVPLLLSPFGYSTYRGS